MKCPLLAFAWGNEGGKEPLVYPNCLKEECAWWDKLLEKCKIALIEGQLDGIRTALFDIVEKKGG